MTSSSPHGAQRGFQVAELLIGIGVELDFRRVALADVADVGRIDGDGGFQGRIEGNEGHEGLAAFDHRAGVVIGDVQDHGVARRGQCGQLLEAFGLCQVFEDGLQALAAQGDLVGELVAPAFDEGLLLGERLRPVVPFGFQGAPELLHGRVGLGQVVLGLEQGKAGIRPLFVDLDAHADQFLGHGHLLVHLRDLAQQRLDVLLQLGDFGVALAQLGREFLLAAGEQLPLGGDVLFGSAGRRRERRAGQFAGHARKLQLIVDFAFLQTGEVRRGEGRVEVREHVALAHGGPEPDVDAADDGVVERRDDDVFARGDDLAAGGDDLVDLGEKRPDQKDQEQGEDDMQGEPRGHGQRREF